MKHLICLLIVVLYASSSATAQISVDFSAEEGYHDGPLDRQPDEGVKWVEKQPGSFRVDATNGNLVFDSSAKSWANVTYEQALGVGTSYIIALDFRVTIGSPTLSGAISMLNRFDLVGRDGIVSVSIRQIPWKPNSFDLWISDAVGGEPSNSTESAGFSGAEMGIEVRYQSKGYQDNVSDNLRLLIVHKYSGEDLLFNSVAFLKNMDTDKPIARIAMADWDVTKAWMKQADKKISFSTGNMNQRSADKGATSFAVQSMKVGVGME